MDPLILFLKAQVPAGARWITIHPHGKEEKGQPVLIEPQADGSAKVIGGAGGALNHLRIRAVKSEAEYKADAEKERKAKADAKKAQTQRDKAAGILQAKKDARERVKQQQREHEQEFVQTVASALGWKPEEIAFKPEDHPNLSPAAMKAAAEKHHNAVLRQANEAVEQQRQMLVADAEMRSAAGLGELPLETKDPAVLTVADVAPVPSDAGGLGFTPDYAKRAEAAGLAPGDLKREADQVRQAKQAGMTDAQREAAVKRGETAQMVKNELLGIREPVLPVIAATDLKAAKQAVELLKARKKLVEINKQATKARGEIDKAQVEPKAYVLEYTADPDTDKKIVDDVANDLRTIQTHAFLQEYHKLAGNDPTETLGKHLANGAFNSINSLALAVSGEALVDRSVVDVLGIAGAAQVLARRIHADLPESAEKIAAGMQEFHLHNYMETSSQAMTEARELMDVAKEIEVGEAANGVELQAGQELNARRRRAIVDAQKTLGLAAGEMEANAALVVALKQGRRDQPLQVSLGKLGAEDAVTRARAIGLRAGDYSIDTSAGSTFLNIKPEGLDRLAQPIDRATLQQSRRNLAIMTGQEDEDGWLPHGVARRPDLGLVASPGVVPRLAKPFSPGANLQQSLKDYIGGRAADGDTPADIIADIQSADFFQKAGDGYAEALAAVAPLKGADGKQRRAEDLGDTFDRYADEFVSSNYGGTRSALNRQAFKVDDVSTEALHRALSEHPDGVAAYKAIGDLTNADQRTLREVFYREVAKESPEAASLRHELETHEANQPEAEVEDMFGDRVANPEHEAWASRRADLAAKVGQASLDWPKYAEMMRGHEKAYETIQDLIRSKVSKSFAEAHNTLRPGEPIKVGRAVIRGNLNHLDATDPAAREQRQAREAELIDSLRERSQGRYAAGAVSDKLDQARDEREAFDQAQMGFFSSEDAPAAPEGGERPLLGDERHTIGHVAERQVAAMMERVGANFKPGQPLKVAAPAMSGGDNFARQRAVKLIDANGRMGLHLGAGSGKTIVGMAAFTHMHAQGKAKRAVFAVPSIVQGQFGGEALKFLEPGKYKWHCEPGASRDERIAAYKDASNHFCVVTHQALRDDMIHLGAKHAGVSDGQMRSRLSTMTRGERAQWARDVMQREGIGFDMSVVDEGHNLLDRAGKEDSGMSLAIGGVTDATTNHVSMTADPIRNDDASEVFSALQKIAPAKYTDRAAFMRRYGGNTVAAKDGLRREMALHFYAHSIQPDVNRERKTITSKLTEPQREELAQLDKHLAAMRLAKMTGKVDVAAARAVNPGAFEGVPAAQHEEIAKGLQAAAGIMRETAMQRIINEHPQAGKVEDLVREVKSMPGQPGLVFARSLKAVKSIQQRLEREGHKVITITGADSSQEKDAKRRAFESGQADILVASDAASTGLNAQRGQWLVQYDTPMTAMTHAQRQARIDRIGQKNNIRLIDMVADHPAERRARDRLARKYAMRDVMTSPAERLDDSGLAMYLQQRQSEAGQNGSASP